MRLLQANTSAPRLASFADPPPYAILSHTWTSDEVLFKDVRNGVQMQKKSWSKIQFCITQAQRDGLDYVWIDTCCIDRSSSAELAEAINSCYSWYAGAQVCYAYLEDVKITSEDNYTWFEPFRRSRWFTRGWTLPELLAPKEVIFFDRNGTRLGSKLELLTKILDSTGIPERALRGDSMSTFTIKERLKWAKNRETTRIEDEAYCLCGIFDVSMPIMYGEGGKAWSRLMVEIGSDKPGWPLWPTDRDSQKQPKSVTNGSVPTGVVRLSATKVPVRRSAAEDADCCEGEEDAGEAITVEDTGQSTVSSDEPLRSDLAVTTTVTWKPTDVNGVKESSKIPAIVVTEASIRSDLFRPLNKSSFRLLTIEPGTMGDAITGTIQEHEMTAPPSYHALSYVWGQEPPIHRTMINDNDQLIRPNLYHALQRVRLPYGKYSIWVDSMCINQNDSSERNQQVRQMSTIYGQANGVLIWLGEEDSTSKAALEYIAKITEKDFRWSDQWWQDYGLFALNQLVQRPWFRRGWVLQEAASSMNSTLLCGDQQVHMDYFITATRTIRDRLSSIPLPLNSPLAQFHDSAAIRLIDIITGVFKKMSGGQHRRIMLLEDLVHRTTYSEVTDQRDAIYVLLNLADDGTSYGGTGIVPDYTKPVLDVMVDFILHCCETTGQLDIICRPWAPCYSPSRHGLIAPNITARSLHHYPSWLAAKDRLPFGDPARKHHRRIHGDPLSRRGDLRCYYAHYGSRPIISFGRNPTGQCDGSLQARGIIVGKICEKSARMADSIISKHSLDILRKGSYNQHFDTGQIPDAIWRTLCADRDEKGERASQFYHAAIGLLLQFNATESSSSTFDPLDGFTSADPEEIFEYNFPEFVEQYVRVVRDVVWNRRTFHVVHESNKIDLVGLGPQNTRVGDQVCILYGCSVPVVLRKETGLEMAGKDTWRLVGEAYVHGIMDGETISRLSAAELRSAEQDFVII